MEKLIFLLKIPHIFRVFFSFTSSHGFLLPYFFQIVTQTLRIQEKKDLYWRDSSMAEWENQRGVLVCDPHPSLQWVTESAGWHQQHMWWVCSTQVSQTQRISALCSARQKSSQWCCDTTSGWAIRVLNPGNKMITAVGTFVNWMKPLMFHKFA